MADFVFNIAKGRAAEFYNRVKLDDPVNSALIVLVLATAGLESDAVLKDAPTVTALLAGTTNEVTNTPGYARKTITQANIGPLSPDYVNDRVDLDIEDQTWTAVPPGDGWSKLIVAYDNDTSVAGDGSIIPMTAHDFVITPDGSDIVAQIALTGFFRAS